MSALLAIVFASLAYLIIRLLHLTASSYAPFLFVKDQSSQFVQSVLDLCPILQQSYVPPLLWGKSGHAQTLAYAKMGRVSTIVPLGARHSVMMSDGATLTFDVYEPHSPHKSGGSYCILICPGIGSSSESAYIRTMVDGAQSCGFTSVVLNHLGALKNVPLTSPRMFTYGGTEELKTVRQEVERMHPGCGLILIGCSMGANIVLKYLGENPENQRRVLAAMSVCNGYDIVKAMPHLLSWENSGRLYVQVITANQKRIMRCHRQQLLTDQVKKEHNIDEDKVFSSRFLLDLDESYTRKRLGFSSVLEYYNKSSASHVLHNIKIPLLLVNAEDDPLVPVPLLEIPKLAASQLPNCMFVLTKHGGHLGYFEKGLVYPHQVTWIDRLLVEFSEAVVTMHQAGSLPMPWAGDGKTYSSRHQESESARQPKTDEGAKGDGVTSLPQPISNGLSIPPTSPVMASGFGDMAPSSL